MNENKANLPVVEITSNIQQHAKQKTEEKNSELQLSAAVENELALKVTKSTEKPTDKRIRHKKSTLE